MRSTASRPPADDHVAVAQLWSDSNAVLTRVAQVENLVGDADLSAISTLTGTGLLARTGAATYTTRTIIGTPKQVIVSNGDGVSGNPTLKTPQDIDITAHVRFEGVNIQTGDTADPTLSFTTTNTVNQVNWYLDESNANDMMVMAGQTAGISTYLDLIAVNGQAMFLRLASGANRSQIVHTAADAMLIENLTSDCDIIFQVLDGVAVREVMRIDASTSKIGIGTVTPDHVLSVTNALANANIAIFGQDRQDDGQDSRIIIGPQNAANMSGNINYHYDTTPTDQYLSIQLAGDAVGTCLNICDGALVGIGTYDAVEKLTLKGNMIFTNDANRTLYVADVATGVGKSLTIESSGSPDNTGGALNLKGGSAVGENAQGDINLLQANDINLTAAIYVDIDAQQIQLQQNVKVEDLTANKLVGTDGNKVLVSYDLMSWIDVHADGNLTIADDGDGTVTLNTIQGIKTNSSPVFEHLTINNTSSFGAILTANQIHTNLLQIRGGDGVKYLEIDSGSNLTVDRILTLTTGDANRTITLTGNTTLNQAVDTTASPQFTGLHLYDSQAGGSMHTIAEFEIDESGGTFTKSLLIKIDPEDNDPHIELMADSSGGQQSKIYIGNTSSGRFLCIDKGGDVSIPGDVVIGAAVGTNPNARLQIDGSIKIQELASAIADTAGYGQLWAKDNAGTTELWFTQDDGTDRQLAYV